MPSGWLYGVGSIYIYIWQTERLTSWNVNLLQRIIVLAFSTACEDCAFIRCKQRNLLIEECKSNDRITNPDYIQSIRDPIADHQCPSEIPSSARIQWLKDNHRATWSYLDLRKRDIYIYIYFVIHRETVSFYQNS